MNQQLSFWRPGVHCHHEVALRNQTPLLLLLLLLL